MLRRGRPAASCCSPLLLRPASSPVDDALGPAAAGAVEAVVAAALRLLAGLRRCRSRQASLIWPRCCRRDTCGHTHDQMHIGSRARLVVCVACGVAWASFLSYADFILAGWRTSCQYWSRRVTGSAFANCSANHSYLVHVLNRCPQPRIDMLLAPSSAKLSQPCNPLLPVWLHRPYVHCPTCGLMHSALREATATSVRASARQVRWSSDTN